MGEVFTASNGKAETAVSNTREKEHPSRDWFPSGSWFWVTPVSVSAQMILGALQVCREEVEVEEGGTDLQTGMIPILGSPPWCCACAHALISLGIITLGSTLSSMQMENIKKRWWCNVSVKNICPLPPPAHGSEAAMEKRTFLLPLADFSLDRAQTNLASINLFSFITHVSEHFKSWIP